MLRAGHPEIAHGVHALAAQLRRFLKGHPTVRVGQQRPLRSTAAVVWMAAWACRRNGPWRCLLSAGGSGTVGPAVLGAGHPLVARLVGAGAVEVELGGLLRLCLSGVHRRDAARTGGRSGKGGSGEQELSSKRGCRSGWPRT